MRWITLLLISSLIGCGSQDEAETDAGAASFSEAQAILDLVASRHASLQRLTLHAVPAGKTVCTQIASTVTDRRGEPSDPEDLKALSTGKEVVLDEPKAIDVTVPILAADGKATAVAGVTLVLKEGADRAALVAEARVIAQELEKALQAANKPLW